ncbi:hypothetical protein RJ55_02928 [Drechmeria coniospora]|nr:hypothetical protein RJ55_02928 [Drechmeria coniospora]
MEDFTITIPYTECNSMLVPTMAGPPRRGKTRTATVLRCYGATGEMKTRYRPNSVSRPVCITKVPPIFMQGLGTRTHEVHSPPSTAVDDLDSRCQIVVSSLVPPYELPRPSLLSALTTNDTSIGANEHQGQRQRDRHLKHVMRCWAPTSASQTRCWRDMGNWLEAICRLSLLPMTISRRVRSPRPLAVDELASPATVMPTLSIRHPISLVDASWDRPTSLDARRLLPDFLDRILDGYRHAWRKGNGASQAIQSLATPTINLAKVTIGPFELLATD